MFFAHWLTVAAVAASASLPLAATAQQIHRQADPANPNATVAASTYRSAFHHRHAAAEEEQESPDQVWRDMNDEVQRLGGHAGHMEDAESSGPASAPKVDAHAGHHREGH